MRILATLHVRTTLRRMENGRYKISRPFKGLGFYVEIVLVIMSFVFVLLFAAVVRVLGTDRGYKVLFIAFAFMVVMKTYFGW